MKRKYILLLCLVFFLTLNLNFLSAQILKSSYNTPATIWESEALPLGNGNLGIMVFGDVVHDLIQVNEHSLWSGGPGKNPSYNGGHAGNANQHKQNLQNARNALQNKMTLFSQNNAAYLQGNNVIAHDYSDEDQTLQNYINNLMGDKSDFGSYQSLSNINIAHPSIVNPEIIHVSGNCDNPNNPNEGLIMLFDNNSNTKWFSDNGFQSFPCEIFWEYDDSFSFRSYQLTSGNDMPERDPKSWNLYASNNGNTYTLIDSRSNITFSGRNQTLSFNLSQTHNFKYFKLEITSINTNGNSPQLSDFTLIHENQTPTISYTNYHRELNIEDAISTITYREGGVNYTRQYFVSYPDSIILIRYSADQTGKITRNIWLNSPQTSISITANQGKISMEGKPADHHNNGLKFAQEVLVIPSGGNMRVNGKKIEVENADEILIISSAATNYKQCLDETFNYFSPTSPLSRVENILTNARNKTFSELLNRHTQDYHSLYNRLSLQLANASNNNDKTTTQLLNGYKNNSNTQAENRYLEQLYFQFGRYLLISSSRQNTLPANLQGIWADGLSPAWSSDYHTNINLQMNYWLAQQTNLSECHWPVIQYVKSLVPRGRQTAKEYYCKQDGGDVRGWVIHHENNIWGNTAPGNYYWGFYFPAAAAWMCQDIWEYYQFNKDINFLSEYYPIMLDAALFWVDNLWLDSRDNTLVANPSYSPEHGPYSLGASSDQAIIAELFDMVLKASEVLGDNSSEINEVINANNKLSGPKIGLGGQLMEWKDETLMDLTGDNGHRHANHLFWLHPGSQVITGRSALDNTYAEAIKKTLNTRGDGGTGWSKAWKINFWARLHDGNRSHKLVQEILKESTLSNLFDTHPPFQIDGNFGSTAGMTEMLIQSQGEYIELLPALPDVWNNGEIKGVKARGNFEINMAWNNGEIEYLEISSHMGGDCKLKYNNISNYYIATYPNGHAVQTTIIDNNTLSFPSTNATRYRLQKTPIVPLNKPDLIVTDITWEPENPKEGDHVIFTAHIKNQGTAPTPDNIKHGVSFHIDEIGGEVTWNDLHFSSLSSNEEISLTANGGSNNNNFWICGDNEAYQIIAWVNDNGGTFEESDLDNNLFMKQLEVSILSDFSSIQNEKQVFFKDKKLYILGYTATEYFSIYNLWGEKVKNRTAIIDNNYELSLSQGLYIIKIENDKKVDTYKILIGE